MANRGLRNNALVYPNAMGRVMDRLRVRRARRLWLVLIIILALVPAAWFVSNRASAQQLMNEDAQKQWGAETELQYQRTETVGGFTFILPADEKDIYGFGWDGESHIGFAVNTGPETRSGPLFSPSFIASDQFGGPHATYELANQPSYTVSLGPINLIYKGAKVRITEALGDNTSACSATTESLSARSGWSGAFGTGLIWGLDSTETISGLAKGTISATVVLSSTGGSFSCRSAEGEELANYCDGQYIFRYTYHPPGGGRAIDFYQKPVERPVVSRWTGPQFRECSQYTVDPHPKQFWSVDGSAWLDVSGDAGGKAVIYWGDGSTEEVEENSFIPFTGTGPHGCRVAPAFPSSVPIQKSSAPPTLRSVDRNGNVTTYTRSMDGNTETITDPRGRQTVLMYEPSTPNTGTTRRLRKLRVPAPAGNSAGFLEYTLSWRALAIDFGEVFPEITCGTSSGRCGDALIDVVEFAQVPDGRRYTFEYGAFGNLTKVTEPGGGVRVYEYGDQTNTEYAIKSVPLTTRPQKVEDGSVGGCAIWTGQAVNLQKHGVLREKVYPQGEGAGNPDVTSTTYEHRMLSGGVFDPFGASMTDTGNNSHAKCDSQVWRVVTLPDGTVGKQGFCANSFSIQSRFTTGPLTSHEWELGTETWTAGQGRLLSATYNGNKETGELFYAFGRITAFATLSDPAADRRLLRTVSVKDGVASMSRFVYGDLIDIDPQNPIRNRETKNITSQSVWSCATLDACLRGMGQAELVRTDTNYFHPAPYFDPTLSKPSSQNRIILHLPKNTTVTDPARGLLTRTEYDYDEFDLLASGAPNLDTSIGRHRGNVTRTTSYQDAAAGTGPISSSAFYFDTGAAQRTVDPRGHEITMAYDFRSCAATSLLTDSVTNVINGRSHTNTTVKDCSSGAVLRVTDPNNQSVYTQYDLLGRPVETAGPGDTLTPVPGFTKDPSAPTSNGSTVGSDGRGPTTWIEYLSLGVINQQRTVAHTKDGTTNGRYVKTFLDGLGRATQTRTEVDPATSGGSPEVVATTQYDGLGRVHKAYVPIFSSASDSYVAPSLSALATQTTYDALGRAVTAQAPGIPQTQMAYSGSGGQWVTTTTNPNGKLSKTFTDLLGRVVKSSRLWPEGMGACADPILGSDWCSTVMEYDAAGRMLKTTDPRGNEMRIDYDGLGRKENMTDPDMGTWTYEYDNNGNLTKQTDAKGQVVTMRYDFLNRITLKDLPPEGPSEEDVTYFYDGDQPGSPPPPPPPPPGPTGTNVALASNGGVASASSTVSAGYPASGANNGDRRGLNWEAGGGWNDGTAGEYPDLIEVAFNGNKRINEIDVFTVQDTYWAPSEPTEAMTFTQYGITDFRLEYWNGSAWATVSGSIVSGNNRVWRKFTFADITTNKIRVNIANALSGHSRITEIEAYGIADGAPPPPPPPSGQTPFHGPHNVPGITQAEDFDNGGSGVAWLDNDPGNGGGVYRGTNVDGINVDVDIAADGAGGHVVFNARAGEWMEYTVNVTTPGDYDIVAKVASGGEGGKFHYTINPGPGQIDTAQTQVPDTGSWGTYLDAPPARVSFSTTGTRVIRITLDQNGRQQFPAVADFASFNIVASGSPPPPPPPPTSRFSLGQLNSTPGSAQWFEVPYNSNYDVVRGQSITVEAWIKTTVNYPVTCSSCPLQNIISRYNPTSTKNEDGGYELWVTASGRPKFAVYKNKQSKTAVESAQVLQPNQWYHIAGVYDGRVGNGTLNIYVQGVPNNTWTNVSEQPRFSATSKPLMVGRSNDATFPNYFGGWIDEVRISMSSGAPLYTGGAFPLPSGELGNRPDTKGLWKFNNQDGSDSSATAERNNPGTPRNGAGFSPDVPALAGASALPYLDPFGAWLRQWFAQAYRDDGAPSRQGDPSKHQSLLFSADWRK